jgi:hypothetical protein
MAAKKKPIEATAVNAALQDRVAWETPYVPARSVTGTVVQDVPAADAVGQLVAWLKVQKLI